MHRPPLDSFRQLNLLRHLSADFTGLHTEFCPLHAGVSGEAFQGVTPSFHLSNYQFTELIETALCAAFSATNKSHDYNAWILQSLWC